MVFISPSLASFPNLYRPLPLGSTYRAVHRTFHVFTVVTSRNGHGDLGVLPPHRSRPALALHFWFNFRCRRIRVFLATLGLPPS
jgi:hypothetical protein